MGQGLFKSGNIFYSMCLLHVELVTVCSDKWVKKAVAVSLTHGSDKQSLKFDYYQVRVFKALLLMRGNAKGWKPRSFFMRMPHVITKVMYSESYILWKDILPNPGFLLEVVCLFLSQVDFDDGHCPSWQNQLKGLYNLHAAVHGKLPGGLITN